MAHAGLRRHTSKRKLKLVVDRVPRLTELRLDCSIKNPTRILFQTKESQPRMNAKKKKRSVTPDQRRDDHLRKLEI